jgi:general stress protein 26
MTMTTDENAVADAAVALVQSEAGAEAWKAILADDAQFLVLNGEENGADAVAERMASKAKFGHLEWRPEAKRDSSLTGHVYKGMPREGTNDRGMCLMFDVAGGKVTRICQQNLEMIPREGTPMVMDAALRQRFDNSLADKSAMSLAYVDEEGVPHLSLRGSLRTFGEDKLCMWARISKGGIAKAVRSNPNVALFYRKEDVRATYQLRGRAYVVEDEATRKAIYDGMPKVERDHDFAMLGEAIIIELDLVEGWAGFAPNGLLDPVRLVRE